jgi:hypothetical protein
VVELHKFSVTGFVISWIARLFYLGALTALIPFGAVLITSGLSEIPETIRAVPTAALALAGVSVLVLFFYHGHLAHVLAALGWMTLLPGIGGAIFLLLKRETLFAFLTAIFSGFALVEPFIAAVEKALPNAWLFVIGYLVLGVMFIYVAGKMEREHAVLTQMRKLFGPRARIFRSR